MNNNIKFHADKLDHFMALRNDGLFIITGARIISGEDMSERCDFSNWGPVSARDDESLNTSSMGTPFFSHVSEIEKYEIIYSCPPHGYIIYLKLKDENTNQVMLTNDLPVCAPSFGEVIRLLIEWSIVAKEPFNNKDRCAGIATEILKDMNMTEEIINHVLETYPPMQIAKFIMGDTSAREQNQDPFEIDLVLKNFFLEQSIPSDYIEINGEVVSIDDERIFDHKKDEYTK